MIRVQNIYCMLAYAFQALRVRGLEGMETEEFPSTADLFAEILFRGTTAQLRRGGLGREFIEVVESTPSPRGRIDVTASLKTRSMLRHQLVCGFDSFDVDTRMNRILKATCMLLLKSDASRERKKRLRGLMTAFSNVRDVDLATVDWRFRFDRNNQAYRMLMGVCWLTAKGLLQTQDAGRARLAGLIDDQRMSRLYEKFILEYFRAEHPELGATASHIPWALDDGFDEMLPRMRSDVTLSKGSRVLIIDAKYYASNTQQHLGKRTVHSANLYQIFTYVKNAEAASRGDCPKEVSGMLLYARTDEEVQPCGEYRMSGNRISARTLDLGLPFAEVRRQLDGIAAEYFGG